MRQFVVNKHDLSLIYSRSDILTQCVNLFSMCAHLGTRCHHLALVQLVAHNARLRRRRRRTRRGCRAATNSFEDASGRDCRAGKTRRLVVCAANDNGRLISMPRLHADPLQCNFCVWALFCKVFDEYEEDRAKVDLRRTQQTSNSCNSLAYGKKICANIWYQYQNKCTVLI